MQRQSIEVLRTKMRSLADNSDFQTVYNVLRDQYIRDIECCRLDGSPEKDRKLLDAAKNLHALLDIKAAIVRQTIQQQAQD